MSKTIKIKFPALSPHPFLGKTGMMSELIKREKTLAKKGGKERKKHLDKIEILEAKREALKADIIKNGIRVKPKVCPAPKKGKFYLLDGRHRSELGEEAGLKEIECELYEAEEASSVIMSANLQKPMTKGALAYLALCLHPDVASKVHGGDRKSSSQVEFDLTAEKLAKQVGVSKGLMAQAVELYRMLNQTNLKRPDGTPYFVPKAKAKFEDAIFTPGNGLQGVKFGITDFQEKGGVYPVAKTNEERRDRQISNTIALLTSFTCAVSKIWKKAGQQEREKIVTKTAMKVLQDEEFATALIAELNKREE